MFKGVFEFSRIGKTMMGKTASGEEIDRLGRFAEFRGLAPDLDSGYSYEHGRH